MCLREGRCACRRVSARVGGQVRMWEGRCACGRVSAHAGEVGAHMWEGRCEQGG